MPSDRDRSPVAALKNGLDVKATGANEVTQVLRARDRPRSAEVSGTRMGMAVGTLSYVNKQLYRWRARTTDEMARAQNQELVCVKSAFIRDHNSLRLNAACAQSRSHVFF